MADAGTGISDEYARLPLDSILVPRADRQRRVIETKGLTESIKLRGVLNPIIVRRDGTLVAGERRLAASREAGLDTIPVRYLDQLDPTELQIVELEENLKRQDLDWIDACKAIGRIHELYKVSDPEWTLEETGQALSLGRSVISIHLRVFRSIEDEKINQASGLREAYNILLRREQRLAGEALQDMLDFDPAIPPAGEGASLAAPGETIENHPDGVRPPSAQSPSSPAGGMASRPGPSPGRYPPESSTILLEDFKFWAPKYSGRKFNLIHCDFPYGVGVFGGDQAGGARHGQYDDRLVTYTSLIEALCQNLDRLMTVSGHLLFWYGNQHREVTLDLFRKLAPSLVFWPHPLIWIKSDNAGIAADVRNGPRHVYETCFLATRGTRNIVRVVADAYSAPTDKRFHVSTKPEPMLKHFLSMLVDENTRVLDPTCGGGSSLRAAEALGAEAVLGMDVDETSVGVARQALRQARNLRTASATTVGL